MAGAAIVAGVGWRSANAQPAQGQQGQTAPRSTPPPSTADEQPSVDPQAEAILRRMSDYLTSLQTFRVSADHATEAVLEDGQRIQLIARSTVAVQRPNRLRSDRVGELAQLSLYYDGEQITLYGPRRNVYATTTAPPQLDEAIDFGRTELDMEAPAADLLYSDLYEGMMDGVQTGIYVGPAEIDGRRCHHLAFSEDEVDWQIWIQDGPEPLPLRYVIVTKDVQSMPEFIVELHDWETSPELDRATFEFEPPRGARQVAFPHLWATAAHGQR